MSRPSATTSARDNGTRVAQLEVEVQTLREENDVLRFHLSSLQSSSATNLDAAAAGRENHALRQRLGVIEEEARCTAENFDLLIREHEKLLEVVDRAGATDKTCDALRAQLATATAEGERHRTAWEHARRIGDERGARLREAERRATELSVALEQAQRDDRQHREHEKQLEQEKTHMVEVSKLRAAEEKHRVALEEVGRAQSEVVRLREQLKNTAGELLELKQVYEHATSRVSTLTADNTVLQEQHSAAREKTRQLQDDFDVFRAHMGRVTQQRDAQAREIQQLRNEIFQLKKVSSANQALVTAAWRAMPHEQQRQQQQKAAAAVDDNEEGAHVDVDDVMSSVSANGQPQKKKRTASAAAAAHSQNNSRSAAAALSMREPSTEAKKMARALVEAALAGGKTPTRTADSTRLEVSPQTPSRTSAAGSKPSQVKQPQQQREWQS